MNHRTMFNKYPMGFTEYNSWSEHVHNMWAEHSLGCDYFGEKWLRRWEALGRLLKAKCVVQWRHGRDWHTTRMFTNCSVGYVLRILAAKTRRATDRRIVLMNGTVVKEWASQ